MSTTAGTPERAGRKEWLGLALLALPSLLLFMMLTILFLAIPHMAADLAPSSTQLLWILARPPPTPSTVLSPSQHSYLPMSAQPCLTQHAPRSPADSTSAPSPPP